MIFQVCNGLEFMEDHKNEFDVIITDPCDTRGLAKTLFSESYISLLKKALKPGGIICSKGENIWAGLELVKQYFELYRKHFNVVR